MRLVLFRLLSSIAVRMIIILRFCSHLPYLFINYIDKSELRVVFFILISTQFYIRLYSILMVITDKKKILYFSTIVFAETRKTLLYCNNSIQKISFGEGF
jgi:hypothetical protein